jgi:hypothetical protein
MLASRGGECQVNHPLHGDCRQRRLSCRVRPIGLAGSPRDLGRAAAIGRRQDDFGAPNMLLRRVAIADNRVKLTAIGVTFTRVLMTRA